MSVWIAGPVILGLFLGKWLDSKYGTAPYLLLSTLAIAFLASAYGIVRETRRYMREAALEDKEEDKEKKDHPTT
jgi:F0F1-type ATP synthase assembly protein I